MNNTTYLPAALAEQLPHPYARYGLAVALRRCDLTEPLTDEELRDFLVFAIEDGLGHFRMRTADDPQHSTVLKFEPVRRQALLDDTNLVQSAGLAAKGIYLFPTVVTLDGGAKDTFKNAQVLLEAIKAKKAFDSSVELSRSFAPTTAKINNGTASQTPPKGTLLEAVCSLITTLTDSKPAAWPGINTVIVPELPLVETRQFISLFGEMAGSESKDLMLAKLPPKLVAVTDTSAAKPKKIAAPKKAPPSEYRRPRLHAGNYPDAPYQPEVFGPVGLLAAIGRWARRARKTAWASEVLASLADAPLYVVSYDSIRQVRFGHHVVKLAQDNQLADIVAALYRDTVLYRDSEAQRRYDNPTYQLFYFTAARFLQLFNRAAFADFLAQRAEYPAALHPLFNAYFMSNPKIPAEVVESAKALGRWLNNTAYRVAQEEVDAVASNRSDLEKKALRDKTKAKILVEFESAAMSATSAPDLLARISIRAGRLLGSDAPAAADVFMDEVATGAIDLNTSKQLLIAYMRLRGKTRKPAEAGEVAETTATDETIREAEEDASIPESWN